MRAEPERGRVGIAEHDEARCLETDLEAQDVAIEGRENGLSLHGAQALEGAGAR